MWYWAELTAQVQLPCVCCSCLVSLCPPLSARYFVGVGLRVRGAGSLKHLLTVVSSAPSQYLVQSWGSINMC